MRSFRVYEKKKEKRKKSESFKFNVRDFQIKEATKMS